MYSEKIERVGAELSNLWSIFPTDNFAVDALPLLRKISQDEEAALLPGLEGQEGGFAYGCAVGESLRFICQKEGPKGPAFDSNSSDQVELYLLQD